MMPVSLRRVGVFVVSGRRDETQCGKRGVRKLRYRVKIRGDDAHLDARGFLIDNVAVADFFAERWFGLEELPSCEKIACEAARELAALVGEGCSAVEVTVGLEDGQAALTARWEREKGN